jgi:hypothetical protein
MVFVSAINRFQVLLVNTFLVRLQRMLTMAVRTKNVVVEVNVIVKRVCVHVTLDLLDQLVKQNAIISAVVTVFASPLSLVQTCATVNQVIVALVVS